MDVEATFTGSAGLLNLKPPKDEAGAAAPDITVELAILEATAGFDPFSAVSDIAAAGFEAPKPKDTFGVSAG